VAMKICTFCDMSNSGSSPLRKNILLPSSCWEICYVANQQEARDEICFFGLHFDTAHRVDVFPRNISKLTIISVSFNQMNFVTSHLYKMFILGLVSLGLFSINNIPLFCNPIFS
jgi:hypothetical protein